ncbi:MAG: hypothetical protein IKB07_04750 [Lachnospiraceae bacterium]|nr:hypothetical protein [Lachnospiraceae bacterium]
MNIAFWSNVRHQSGVTSSVALLSVLWTELFVEEITVTSNHISNAGLVKRLYGGSAIEEKTAQKAYCYILGEPEYFRLLYGEKIRTTLWLNDNLRFIPMMGEEEGLFCTRGLKSVGKEMCGRTHLMIDTACGCDLCSQQILEDAEVTVVLFPQEKECIDSFFQSETILRENSFFILGNYREELPCRPSYLIKQYNIPKERIGVIPYNFGFEQAMREGSTIGYIAGNINCTKRNTAYRFIRYATKTVEDLRKYAINRRKAECGDCEKV